jgi:long-chain acyl-CoA synthetase
MSELLERFSRIRRDTPERPLLHLPLEAVTLTANALWTEYQDQRRRLETFGIGPDDLVLCGAGNHAAVPPLWLACRALGAAVLPVDAGTTAPEIRALGNRFGATAAVLAARSIPHEGIDGLTGYSRGLSLMRLTGSEPAPHLYRGAAALKLTSASTGLPKATFTTESQLVADSEHIMAAMDIRPGDCQLASIPISHAYGLGNLVMPLLINGTALVLREGFVPHQFASDAVSYGVRVFPGVPFMFEHFVAHLPKGQWPRTVEILVSAGARLEPTTVSAFLDAFGVKIHSFYGTSESGGISYDDSSQCDREVTVGRALPGVEISLRPEAGAPPGSGRIHVAGEAVSSGYIGEAPADEGFTGGGFLTGDFGRFDPQGRLVLTGRASSFINVAGRKIQPGEVEQVLRTMPGVVDVRVIGAPDPARGQQIVACLVTSGVDPSILAVRQFCASRLAPHKIPRAIVKLDRIPLTERGKTHRGALEALVTAHLAQVDGTRVL